MAARRIPRVRDRAFSAACLAAAGYYALNGAALLVVTLLLAMLAHVVAVRWAANPPFGAAQQLSRR